MDNLEGRLTSGESLVGRLRHAGDLKQAFKEISFWVMQRIAVHNVEGLQSRKPGVFRPSKEELARRHSKNADA